MNLSVLQKKAAPTPELDLSRIRIASTCPADWKKMVGDERIRHCAECNLNVYNLSAMTEREARQLLGGNSGKRMCLRLYRRADGTIITQDCPWGFRALRRRATRFAGAFFSAVLSISFAQAKPIPQQNSQPTEEERKLQADLGVTVVDPQGAVLPNASITLNRSSDKPGGKPQAKGVTDETGRVEFPSLAPGEYAITVEAKYFLTERQSKLQLSAGKSSNLVITMKIDPKATTTVEVGMVEAPLIQTDAQVTHVFYLDR